MSTSPWWSWLAAFLFGAPWLAGAVYYWLQRPRDGWIPPSMADEARRRYGMR